MQIYRGTIELLDYLFYATVERGKVYETGAFVHNYALAYALGLVRSETYAYSQLQQQPRYAEELEPLNGRLYIAPAAPQQLTYRLMQWNTIREGYAFPGKEPSVGYPDWGFARVLRPGSQLTFFVMVPTPTNLPEAPALRYLLAEGKVRVRLGKFSGKARLALRAADAVLQAEGEFGTDVFLNWRDLEDDPAACDIVATSLPTRLLSRARFADGPYYRAQFGNTIVNLPARMSFLARKPLGTGRGN